MSKRLLPIIIAMFCLCASFFSTAQPLRLVAPQFPPYTSEKNGHFSGLGIEAVEKLLTELDIEYELRSTPNYARALGEVISGRADGFFLASQNAQRDEVATFSKPLMINRWVWFLRKDSKLDPFSKYFKDRANVASLRGSNTSLWLEKNGFNITTLANTADSFPEMLLAKKRLDAVFLAQVVFKQELENQGYRNEHFKEVIQIEKPFGIYISKAYQKDHPDFMKKLNQAITTHFLKD